MSSCESTGFLLEESGCQQHLATGTLMVRQEMLVLQFGQILQWVFNQSNAGALQKAYKGPTQLT